MRADMHEINKEEDKLQREIMNLHLKNLAKHASVINKHKIDVTIKNTEELVRKIMNIQSQTSVEKTKLHEKPQAKKVEVVDEEMLQESIENLDMLLANMKAGIS
jgi:sulfur relay (sulfurtransferase) DsrF/TusC family protein